MARTLIIGIACLISTGAAAFPKRMEVEDVIRDPRTLVGSEIRLSAAKCAREPAGKYACTIEKGSNKLRVESLGLDFKTSEPIRRLIVSRCAAKVEKADQACVFDVELKIQAVRSQPLGAGQSEALALDTRKMNLYAPGSP